MAKKLSVVLAGCGGISRAWLRAVQEDKDTEIVGLMDLRREAAEGKAQEFGLAHAAVGADLDAVLKATKPDVLFNCTVPEAHLPVTLAGLRAGCHVLSEKPLADSMGAARKMVAAAAKAGKVFAVMQNRRYIREIISLNRFLQAGRIGDVTTVECDFHLGAHFGGFRDRMEHVLLLDMSIHHFDMARYIGAMDPEAVYCREWNPKGSWYDHDAAAVCTFEMSRDIMFSYRGSWCTEGLNTHWNGWWRVIGAKGDVIWDGGEKLRAQVSTGAKGFSRKRKDIAVPLVAERAMPGAGHTGQVLDFLRCLRTGRTPQTVGRDNIKSLGMVFGAIESAARARRVMIHA